MSNIKGSRQCRFDSVEPLLHTTIQRGNVKTALSLIKERVDINTFSVFGQTPLHLAVQSGQIRIVKALIANGADIEARTFTSHGQTPLLIAVQQGHIEIIQLLVSAGANINGQSDTGWTPLHNSVWYCPIEITQLLLQLGADPSIENMFGLTPIQLALEGDDEYFHDKDVAVLIQNWINTKSNK